MVARWPWSLRATEGEALAWYPCDDWAQPPFVGLVRAIDVAAPADLVFRWVCQLRTAPYSFDWLDNLGRRSSQQLQPGVDRLQTGQQFQVTRIVDFQAGRHITGAAQRTPCKLFGLLSLTYLVGPGTAGGSRLLVRLDVEDLPGRWRRLRRVVLAWGDLLMMDRQLKNLRRLAERDHRLRSN